MTALRLRPRYRVAVLITVAFAGGAAWDHHDSFWHHSWSQSVAVAAECFAFSVAFTIVVASSCLWAMGKLGSAIASIRKRR